MAQIEIIRNKSHRRILGRAGVCTAATNSGAGLVVPECFGVEDRNFTENLIERCGKRSFRAGRTCNNDEVVVGKTIGCEIAGESYVIKVERGNVHNRVCFEGFENSFVASSVNNIGTCQIGYFERFGQRVGTGNHDVVEADLFTGIAFEVEFDGDTAGNAGDRQGGRQE